MPQPAIVLERITKSYADGDRRLEILRGADLTVESGELLAIVGPSGCGKSTLLYAMGGLDRRHGGRVIVAGRELTGLDDRALSSFRATTIGFVFQAFNLLPQFTALENVLLPGLFGATSAVRRDEALAAMERVGLGGKTHRLPGALSGGERQRVAIARALCTRPSIVLADEPTGNLDTITGGEIIALFQAMNREHRTTLVIVTHEERVSNIATRVLRLADGKLVEDRP